MPKYLLQGSYTTEGVRGLLKEGGTSRKGAIEKLAKSLGGSVEAYYYAFGEDDIIVIVDLPDQTAATAMSLTLAATPAARGKTTVLIDPAEVDEAAKRSAEYRPPQG